MEKTLDLYQAISMPETNRALVEYYANNPLMDGIHRTELPELARSGAPVAEVEYIPSKHYRYTPDAFSINAIVTGKRHVAIKEPRHTADIDVVIHNDPADRHDPSWISAAKRSLVSRLCAGVLEAHTGFGDRAYVSIIGDTKTAEEDFRSLGSDLEIIKDTEKPVAAAEAVNDIATHGLTVVFSTFKNLPIHERNDHDPLLAVKVNHLFEIESQPDTGTYTTGLQETPVIDTNDQLKLASWNAWLRTKHERYLQQLAMADIPTASVIFDRKQYPRTGFSMPQTDNQIAQAISSLSANA